MRDIDEAKRERIREQNRVGVRRYRDRLLEQNRMRLLVDLPRSLVLQLDKIGESSGRRRGLTIEDLVTRGLMTLDANSEEATTKAA